MSDEFDTSAVYEAMNFSISADPGKPPPKPKEYVFDSEDDGILALSAGWQRQNILSSWSHKKINEWVNDAAPDPTFPRDKSYHAQYDEANLGYPPHQMVLAESAEEAEFIRGQIDNEYEQMQLINSHWLGTVGEFGGAILRPELMIGGIGGPARSLGGLVVKEALLEAGSEGMLQHEQRTRTAAETAINVASAGVMTAFIGKAIDVGTQLRSIPPPQRAVEGDPDHLGVTQVYDSAGAQRATQDPEDARLAGGWWADLLSWGPQKRLTSSKSPIATAANEDLVTPSMYTKGMEKGQTRGQSVEAKKDQMQGEVITVFDRIEELGERTDLSPDEFADEVGKALSSHDKHLNPHVQEAAEIARKEILDTRLNAAQELGHNIQPKPGQSYFPRMFNRGEILDDFDNVKDMLVDHYNQVFKGELKDANRIVDKTEKKAYSASNKMIGKMENLVKKLSVVPARQRTAKQIVKLEKARKELKLARAENKRMLAKQTPRVRIKAAEKLLVTMKKPVTAAQKAAQKKIRDHIKELKAEQKAYVKEKAAAHVRTEARVSDDISRDADRAAIDTIHNMMGGLPHTHGVAGVPQHLKQRSLELTDQMLEPYLEKNAINVLSQYTGGMDPYVLMKQEFGDTTMADIFDGIRKDYAKLIEDAKGGTRTIKSLGRKRTVAEERAALKTQRDSDLRDLTAMRNRVLNRVQRGLDPGSSLEKTVQFMKLYNVSTQLGGITLSSVPDVARPIMAFGLRGFSNGMGTSMRHVSRSLREGKTNAATAQTRRMGIAAQRTLNSRLLEMAEMGEPANHKAMNWVQKKWGKYSGFNHWTDGAETLTAHSAMDWVLRVGKKISEMAPEGQLGRSETMKIARMGFTPEDVKQFYLHAQGTSGGGAIDPTLKFADTLEWNNPELAKLFEAGIGSEVRRAIVRIGVGDKPLGMDNGLWSLVMQYQSFAIASSNKMLVAGLQARDGAMLQGLLVSVFLGGVVGMTKAELRGEDTSQWSNDKFMLEGIDRSGLLGLYNVGFNAARALYGDMPTRYLHRGFQGILGGSTISQVGRLSSIFGDVATGEVDADTAEQVQRLTPLVSNTLHLRQLMQQLGE